ncbi:hypothetical protein V8J88_22550 [Massilia sp. W12]|uniref:hypothetical protein n=1 Tax=Massilia sp. W12 TaxID=3126507 RepID=UPI0030D60B5F
MKQNFLRVFDGGARRILANIAVLKEIRNEIQQIAQKSCKKGMPHTAHDFVQMQSLLQKNDSVRVLHCINREASRRWPPVTGIK